MRQEHFKWMPERQDIFMRVTTSGRYRRLEIFNTDSKAITEVTGSV